jgi:hypothetical protein
MEAGELHNQKKRPEAKRLWRGAIALGVLVAGCGESPRGTGAASTGGSPTASTGGSQAANTGGSQAASTGGSPTASTGGSNAAGGSSAGSGGGSGTPVPSASATGGSTSAVPDGGKSGAPDAGTSPPVPTHSAVTTHAYAALTKGAIDQVSQELEALDAAAAKDPPDEYAVFYSGAFRLWKAAQATSTLTDVLALPGLADEWLSRLTRAHTLLPDDFRITGFLCNAQVIVSGLRSDKALLAQGLTTCDAVIAEFPPYGHFLKAAATSTYPASDPVFASAFDDMTALAKTCGYSGADATHAYSYPAHPEAETAPGVCLDEGIVPHVFEGAFIVFGDLALRVKNDPELARKLYRSAQTAPHYATWPFAKDLEQRIQEADDRAARFNDTNPLNDPDSWNTKICVGCHQDPGVAR